MQKPLARYVDDQDLETLLKSKIRDGDPMLEYITKNKGTGDESPDGVRHGKFIIFSILINGSRSQYSKILEIVFVLLNILFPKPFIGYKKKKVKLKIM